MRSSCYFIILLALLFYNISSFTERTTILFELQKRIFSTWATKTKYWIWYVHIELASILLCYRCSRALCWNVVSIQEGGMVSQ